MSLSLRIDVRPHTTSEETLNMLYSFIVFYSDKFMVSREEGKITGKVHYHGYMLLRDGVQVNSVRQQWKRKFSKWSGRSQERSLAETRDIPTFLAYISKDGTIVSQKGFTDEEIAKYKSSWVNPKEYGKTIDGKIRKYADSLNEKLDSREACHRITCKWFIENSPTVNKYKMYDTAEKIYAQYNPELYIDDYLSWALSR